MRKGNKDIGMNWEEASRTCLEHVLRNDVDGTGALTL